MRWMLDTDTCIRLIKKGSYALRKLSSKPVGQVGVSSITVAELERGVFKSGKPHEARVALTEFLYALEVSDFDAQAARCYGEIRAMLERKGTPIGSFDTLIAGHARALDVVLVTHNTKEFARIPGLRLEDWAN